MQIKSKRNEQEKKN